jgi:dTDP-4-dehydrorhamnose 3,5-epimerase
MRSLPTRLDGPVLLAPAVHGDERGFFLETFRAEPMAALGVTATFVQDNHSRSGRGTLRGMHFQRDPGQAKLVRCARGRVLDVVVDLRRGSPTFGEWEGFELDDEAHHSLFVPVGFAHGFCVLTDEADVVYKCSSYYDPATAAEIAYDDPEVGIAWPEIELKVSARDARAPRLADVAATLPFER